MNDQSIRVPASPERIVVVGASLGGVAALRVLVSGLPADLPAAVLLVLHVGAHPSVLPELLASAGPLPVSHAWDGQPLLSGHIYVAPPDRHLLVESDAVRLTRGPKEHHSRPAVDPLFRSAALAHGPRVVGVVLTGYLDDGTAGLQAIKACGGKAIVQDPADALAPSMPLSALQHVETDYCLPLERIAAVLVALAQEPVAAAAKEPPPALSHEHALTNSAPSGAAMEHLQSFAQPSTLVCPDCGGSLWEVNRSRPARFRCHTGHAFTMRTLAHTMNEGTELALQTAMRALQEQAILLRKFAALSRMSGADDDALALEAGAKEAHAQASLIADMVEKPPIQSLERDLARDRQSPIAGPGIGRDAGHAGPRPAGASTGGGSI